MHARISVVFLSLSRSLRVRTTMQCILASYKWTNFRLAYAKKKAEETHKQTQNVSHPEKYFK